MHIRKPSPISWPAVERQTREAFGEWASYRLTVFRETSSSEWNSDGRVARYLELLNAVPSAEQMASAWSSALDASSSIKKAQYLAGELRTGESVTQFLDNARRLMLGEIGLLPKIRHAFDSSQPSRHGRKNYWPPPQELIFRRYERRLPAYGIPADIDLLVESALYALYVAWSPSSKIVVPDNRKELWRAIAMDEETLRVVTPRRFEELVAFAYEKLGCRTEVTAATRDHGADVLAWHPGPFGTESLIVVQAKLYSGENKVDLAGIHALHGAVTHYNATYGHLVATTDVTGPARQFMDAEGYTFIDLPALRREMDTILSE